MYNESQESVIKLEKQIESAYFDFEAFNEDIEEFGRNNDIPQKLVMNIQLAAEETVHNCIIEFLEHNGGGSGYPITLWIGYYPVTVKVNVEISYDGPRFDPFEYGDELSVLLMERLSAKAAYRYDGMNKVTVSLS